MTQNYSQINDWSTYPQMTINEFAESYPQVMKDPSIEDACDFLDNHEDDIVIVITGNVRISKEDIENLREQYGNYTKIVIEGHLQLTGDNEIYNPISQNFLYVKGNVHAEFLSLDDSLFVVDGHVFVKYFVSIFAEDHEVMREAPTLRITTPLLFSWFYEIDRLTLTSETIIFILGNGDYCAELALPNVIVTWHDAVFVLRPQFVTHVGAAYHDMHCWHFEKINAALSNGQDIFLDGFSRQAMNYCNIAAELAAQNDHRGAYLTYKKASHLFPNYYHAWYGMAEQLWEENAFAQAVQVYQEAMKRFPAEQKGLVNFAVEYGALAAMRNKDFETAIQLSTIAIERNESEYDDDHAFAYRVRSEALYRLKRVPKAIIDIDTALKYSQHHKSANWFKGLLLYRAGHTALAEEHRQIACHRNKDFDVQYDQLDDTDFLVGTPTTLDWDEVDIASFEPPVKDEEYWRTYLRNSDGMQIKRVPDELRTTALCMDVVATAAADANNYDGHVEAAKFFPERAFTHELATALVSLNMSNLEFVPSTFVTKALCMLAPINKQRGFSFSNVPEDIIDEELCLHAARCCANLETLPTEWINKEICLTAIKLNAYAIKHVPIGMHTDEMYFAAIANGGYYHFINHIPSRYKTPDMLKRALAYDKQALHSISGDKFDAELFKEAERLYGKDADWEESVKQHGREACEQDPSSSTSEICWSVFWNEAFILRQIQKKDYQLSAYEIPEQFFTQTIAEACLKREPIHLGSIPTKFITAEMCEYASRRYADEIGQIPVAFRNEIICERAVKDDASLLALVPIALRTAALCITAIRKDEDVCNLVPPNIALEVFDTLIKKHRKEFSEDWLYLQRGDAKLNRYPKDIDGAMLDYIKVAESNDEESIEAGYIDNALYSIGYCHHLRGDAALASDWFAKIDDVEGWPPYDEFAFNVFLDVIDFEKRKFDAHMHDYEGAIEINAYDEAYKIVLAAEQMLIDAGSKEPTLWAYVLDMKRFVSYELELWEVNIASCRTAIERLSDQSLWAYIASDDVIRHTLRGAYNRLGTMPLDDENMSLDALREGLALLKKAMQLVGGGEDEQCLYPYYEGRAALLIQLVQFDNDYKTELEQILDNITTLKLKEKGFIEIDEVLHALSEYET